MPSLHVTCCAAPTRCSKLSSGRGVDCKQLCCLWRPAGVVVGCLLHYRMSATGLLDTQVRAGACRSCNVRQYMCISCLSFASATAEA
jgi:hypothetical protein